MLRKGWRQDNTAPKNSKAPGAMNASGAFVIFRSMCGSLSPQGHCGEAQVTGDLEQQLQVAPVGKLLCTLKKGQPLCLLPFCTAGFSAGDAALSAQLTALLRCHFGERAQIFVPCFHASATVTNSIFHFVTPRRANTAGKTGSASARCTKRPPGR